MTGRGDIMGFRVGSLFSGIGGLDLAVEAALGGRTIWQVEKAPAARAVLARHWPEALQFEDVTEVGRHNLPEVDVLIGGFPCQDVSNAGSREGLGGGRSGLFYHFSRIVGELRPALVIVENVAALLKYRDAVDAELARQGYQVDWCRCYASGAGAPHLRRRVFLVAYAGSGFRLAPPMVDLPKVRAVAAAGWPTPTAGDAGASGSRTLDTNAAHPGTSLTDAVRPDRTVATWPTPKSRDWRSGLGTHAGNLPQREGTLDLPELLKGRLNPVWVESLMGFPHGWTAATGESLRGEALLLISNTRWPSGRGADQFPWEAARLIDGPPVKGRPARLKALGNAVVPHQAIQALQALGAAALLEVIQ